MGTVSLGIFRVQSSISLLTSYGSDDAWVWEKFSTFLPSCAEMIRTLSLQRSKVYQLYIDLLDGQCLLAYVTRVCTMISLFHAFSRAAGLCDFALTLQAFRRFRFTEVVGQTFLQ